jgi:hypothetical protein
MLHGISINPRWLQVLSHLNHALERGGERLDDLVDRLSSARFCRPKPAYFARYFVQHVLKAVAATMFDDIDADCDSAASQDALYASSVARLSGNGSSF